jgi:hypothetical protein
MRLHAARTTLSFSDLEFFSEETEFPPLRASNNDADAQRLGAQRRNAVLLMAASNVSESGDEKQTLRSNNLVLISFVAKLRLGGRPFQYSPKVLYIFP